MALLSDIIKNDVSLFPIFEVYKISITKFSLFISSFSLVEMSFNFDEVVDRRNTCSDKYDAASDPDVIPMWVADMDFKAAPKIIEAVQKRVAHGVYGYASVPNAFYEAIINWFNRRHNFSFEKDWILYTPGVVPSLSAIIKGLTKPGDKVITMTPCYNLFFTSIRNNKCVLSANSLIYKNNTYYIDFEDLEKRAQDPDAKLLILCNPHNPSGRVWTEEELRKVGEICLRNNVFVVSDEIHNELMIGDHKYTPFASLSEEFLMNSATCTSCTKSFNVAGLQISYIICKDEEKRKKIDRAINDNEICDVNPFGIVGLIAAYNESEDWLKALCKYLTENYLFLKDFFSKNLPQFNVTELEGTYLVWINTSVLKLSSQEISDFLIKEEKVMINPGIKYGDDGEGFIRINIACPRATLTAGLERIANGLKKLLEKQK